MRKIPASSCHKFIILTIVMRSNYLHLQEKVEERDGKEADSPETVNEQSRTGAASEETAIKPKLADTGTTNSSPARVITVSTAASHNRHGALKHSDSSFGLHSPDSYCDDVQSIIRKFNTHPQLTTKLSNNKMVLDPDLTDLTMIPPPMTPDEEGPAGIFPGAALAVSTPPTPFADRQTLEAELQVCLLSHHQSSLCFIGLC